MKKWIQKARKGMEDKGTVGEFTKKAERQDKTAQEYASQVMANKERYPPELVKQANFAKNMGKIARHSPRTTVGSPGGTVTLNTGKPSQWPKNKTKPVRGAGW